LNVVFDLQEVRLTSLYTRCWRTQGWRSCIRQVVGHGEVTKWTMHMRSFWTTLHAVCIE